MVFALLISHALGIVFYLSEQRAAVNLIGGEHVSERIVTLAHLIDNTPAPLQDKMAKFADESALHVALTKAPTVSPVSDGGLKEIVVREAFARHVARLGKRDFMVRFADASPAAVENFMLHYPNAHPHQPKMLEVSLQLSDGKWLNFAAIILRPLPIWSLRFILSMLVMTVAVIAVAVIVVGRINVPLRRFALAAERLGTNINAPPLPIRGPREVRQVAAAINDMQRRIHRLLEGRRLILAAVSHDLFTPITLIRLRAEHVTDATERQKMLATLDEMELMVSSILDFARSDPTAEPARRVDLAALVRSLCDDMADLGRPVTFDGPERLAGECRPVALRRALTNVVDNAIKYGYRARVRMTADEDEVTVTVDDDGPGISDAELDRVFAPFYRVDRSRSQEPAGVGLGLSVARQVVAAHGGEIDLANRSDGGLRVTINLPSQPDA